MGIAQKDLGWIFFRCIHVNMFDTCDRRASAAVLLGALGLLLFSLARRARYPNPKSVGRGRLEESPTCVWFRANATYVAAYNAGRTRPSRAETPSRIGVVFRAWFRASNPKPQQIPRLIK